MGPISPAAAVRARILVAMESPVGSDTPVARSSEDGDRLNALYAEAKSAIGYASNQLRAITELYRETHRIELRAWHRDRDELARMDRSAARPEDEATPAQAAADADPSAAPAAAAEAAAAGSVRQELRRSVDLAGSDLGDQQRDLSRLELVIAQPRERVALPGT